MAADGNTSQMSDKPLVIVTETSMFQPFVSDNLLWWMRLVFGGILCQASSLFGIVSNIINIVVFIKLGAKEPMNVSLCGLALSDFLSCFLMVFYNVSIFPPFLDLELPLDLVGVSYLYVEWPLFAFSKVTVAITAFITVERCLCVTCPLKIKELITTKRMIIIIMTFYVLNIGLAAPAYYVNYCDWVFSPERNRSIYTLLFTENRAQVVRPLYFFNGVFIFVCAFLTTIIFTVILVYSLNRNAKWRQEATGGSAKTAGQSQSSSTSKNQISSRDRNVAKMVVIISVVFIVTYFPQLFSTIIVMIFPEIRVGNPEENVIHFIYHFNYLLATVNASLNIFIYYFMSSNYRATFKTMFSCLRNGEKGKS